jgi:hypothetical protein
LLQAGSTDEEIDSMEEQPTPLEPSADEQADGNVQRGRREFVKRTAYVAPVILTLKTAPAYAKHGSDPGKGKGKGKDKH